MKRLHPTDPNLFWCPKCQEYNAREEFSHNRTTHHGISGMCRGCQKKRFAEFPDHKVAGWRRAYRIKNKEKIKLLKRMDYIQHKDIHEARRKLWRGKNKEKVLDTDRRWKRNHPEHALAQKELGAKDVNELRDNYIRHQLAARGLLANEETIELKREQIMLYRELKQLKGEISHGAT